MKDKPLGFQIWIIITLFVILVTFVVTLVVLFTIHEFFSSGTYQFILNVQPKEIISHLSKRICKVLIVISIINITTAKFIAHYITAPLRYLEKQVRKIANKEWTTPIALDRKDEIGKLAVSIHSMQESLKSKDQEEQIFLQTVSHDLKTPIMVIHSYAQAVLDGIYLNNSLEDTVHIILKESKNLENKVKKLLYLNSLDYIMKRKIELNPISLKEVLLHIVNRLSFHHTHIHIHTSVEDIYMLGNEEELTIAFENILENNLRYAKSQIYVHCKKVNHNIKITFENDGPLIDSLILDNLFHRFYKGNNGHFGLGLFITQKIVQFHKGNIYAKNIQNGVIFTILFPESR
ncbi:sensor histidine kinase [Inediibacterium massiliense]|uniref:sensor histidine kinase n=1 Tax=Inediibacterium massiliense TaxID=1658111 RepID=UPI0006B594E1|nr:HAMP domain-containing sensor histidine kinase [Inediibacterium massiliense]